MGERGNFSLQYYKNFRPEAFYYASESTQICATRVFLLSLFYCNFDDQLSPNCMNMFKINRVRIPVFDNYQKCPVPLTLGLTVEMLSMLWFFLCTIITMIKLIEEIVITKWNDLSALGHRISTISYPRKTNLEWK